MKVEQSIKRGAVRAAPVGLACLASRMITGALALLLIAAAFGGRAWAAAAGDKPPPPVTILTPATGLGNGYIFVTPTSYSGKYANGPEILDTQGNVVWFHAIPDKQVSADFRVQRYHGKQVLT